MSAYLVIGAHRVGGCVPGGTVEIEDEVDAARLIAGGHIASKSKTKPAKAEKEQEQ